jgi:histone acetyltransferase MYST1
MRSGAVPLEVTTRLMCRWRDGDFQRVRVVERRKLEGQARPGSSKDKDKTAADWEYYVHYENCAC